MVAYAAEQPSPQTQRRAARQQANRKQKKEIQMVKDIKAELKVLLADDIEKSISKFKEIIDPDSKLFDEFILALGGYNDIKSDYHRNTVSLVEKNIELAKIRGTLMKLINELDQSDLNEELDNNEDEDEISEPAELIEWEEIGILEISEDAVRDLKEITSLFLRLTDYLNHLTQKTSQGTAKINKLKKSNSSPNQLLIKKIVDEVGKEMINYTEKAKPEVLLFKQLANSSIEKATKLVEWSFRDNLINDVDPLIELRDAMIFLKENGTKAKLAMLHYRVTTEKLPNLTTILSKGKKEVIMNTGELIEEISQYVNKLEKFIENLELTILEFE